MPKKQKQMSVERNESNVDSTSSMARALFKQAMEKAKQAEKNNKRAPTSLPYVNPNALLFNFMQYQMQFSPTNGLFQMRSGYITGKVHCSKKPLTELKPIHLAQMKVPMVHKDRVLACRLITEAVTTVGTSVLFEDTTGDIQTASFYNFSTNLCDSSWLMPGMILFIKEPYIKYGLEMQPMLRVDSPSDIIFVHKSNRDMLEMADALCWYQPEEHSAELLKQQGNLAFRQTFFGGALSYYERALAVAKQNKTNDELALVPVLHLNMAAALLELKRYSEAASEVKKALALDGGIDKEKAYLRLGRAAYGMCEWTEAIEHFQTVLHMNPANKLAKEDFERAKCRLQESTTGKYDIRILFDENAKGVCRNIDAAEYVGPIKVVNIEGKGKGLVVTADVPKGTLLFASKAYSTGHTTPGFSANIINLITNEAGFGDMLLCVINAVQRLKREPHTAKDLYGLYGGEGYEEEREEMPPEGVIDAGRIERICSMNRFGMEAMEEDSEMMEKQKACGLWILPSLMNHSCLANTNRIHYGDMMFVTALYDLKKDTELTTAYRELLPPESLEERSAVFDKKWGFHCDCRLCELDRKERGEERERAKMVKYYKEVLKPKLELLPSPKNVRSLIDLLDRMRRTYGQRKEHRYQMIRPLLYLASLHDHLGESQKALDTYNELLDVLGPYKPYFYTIYEFMAKIYANQMANKGMAKKMAQKAFELVKQELGGIGHVDKQLFLHMHPEFGPFMHR